MDVIRVEPLTTARSLRGPFDYRRPDGVDVGAILEVPFGRQRLTGVVTALAAQSEHDLVDPLKVHDVSVPPDLVELALWMASAYVSTPARALGLVLPPRGVRERHQLWAELTDVSERSSEHPRITAKQAALLGSLPRFAGTDLPALRRLERRGLVTIGRRPRRRAPVQVAIGAPHRPMALTDDQQAALSAILDASAGEQLLLHGVTGSGKTEVYLQAAAEVLRRGRSAIILVPEIGLTPQMVDRFRQRFGEKVALLHSKLSDGQRLDEWLRLRRGDARIAVGPRSAVFAPVADLGLVVIDEEHDGSYKHEGDPRYDARLVAQRRAAAGVLVMGTATPRPEAIHAFRRLRLPRRVDGGQLPPVEVVDLVEARGYVHPDTHAALVDARKAIVLLNRRGWSNFLTCRSCGEVWKCPNCDVALVLHRAESVVACHHCGHREPVPDRCAACGSISIARHGTGTEKVEQDLARIAPVLRLDAGVADAGAVLQQFARADRAILVGTQVVAKGHDFPDVDLGVVLDADSTLRFPDFRAEERTFALVTQLAGRAGRGGSGRVIVQTLDPTAPAISYAAHHDADGFLAGELERRRALRYPPFSTLIRVVAASAVPSAALEAATAVRQQLDGALGPAPLFRLRGKERAQVVLKAEDREIAVADVAAAVSTVAADRAHKAAALSVDVDPQ